MNRFSLVSTDAAVLIKFISSFSLFNSIFLSKNPNRLMIRVCGFRTKITENSINKVPKNFAFLISEG